jgi:hypothetical protein
LLSFFDTPIDDDFRLFADTPPLPRKEQMRAAAHAR